MVRIAAEETLQLALGQGDLYLSLQAHSKGQGQKQMHLMQTDDSLQSSVSTLTSWKKTRTQGRESPFPLQEDLVAHGVPFREQTAVCIHAGEPSFIEHRKREPGPSPSM